MRVPATLVITLGIAWFSLGTAPASADQGAARERFDVVVIDAGHGGEDHGALGPKGLAEKDIVLDVSLRLAKSLRARGIKVILTREEDVFVPLETRTALANDARADLFVSVHANAARTSRPRGIETYFVSLEASDENARRVAERENQAFGQSAAPLSASDPLVALLGDMMATQHVEESGEFAKLAHSELARSDKVPPRGVKQAPFVVLMGVQMPATLVEIGFITNAEEERALRSTKRKQAIADDLARAVQQFGLRYDARRGVNSGLASPDPGTD